MESAAIEPKKRRESALICVVIHFNFLSQFPGMYKIQVESVGFPCRYLGKDLGNGPLAHPVDALFFIVQELNEFNHKHRVGMQLVGPAIASANRIKAFETCPVGRKIEPAAFVIDLLRPGKQGLIVETQLFYVGIEFGAIRIVW